MFSSSPLNLVGLPYYDSQLLSAWTPQLVLANVSFPPPPKIPPQILGTMKWKDNVAYAALPRELKGHRNMEAVDLRKQTNRFLSGKTRTLDVRRRPKYDWPLV